MYPEKTNWKKASMGLEHWDYGSINQFANRLQLDYIFQVEKYSSWKYWCKANVWLLQRLESVGWEAIDLKNALFGSDVIDDVLYICCTDGKDIQVGDSLVDPEMALRGYSPEELRSYIVDADDKIVKRYVTEFALAEFDIDESAEQLLKEGKSFIDLMEAAQNLPQLNR